MTFDPTTQEHLEERSSTNIHVLVWVAAPHRDTGVIAGFGFWTGDDHREFSVAGQQRMYSGAGAVIDCDQFVSAVGLGVRTYQVRIPPFTPKAQAVMRDYDPRQARTEIHQVVLDSMTGEPLGPPIRRVRGRIAKAPAKFGAKGDESEQVFEIATASAALTKTLPLVRSAAALKQRDPADAFRTYSDYVGQWSVPWGLE